MSVKNLDRHNRWRNKTVAFRVSPDEDREIETAVRLSGLTKQDYITHLDSQGTHITVIQNFSCANSDNFAAHWFFSSTVWNYDTTSCFAFIFQTTNHNTVV